MGASDNNIRIDITAVVDGSGFTAGAAQVDKVTAAFNKTEAAANQATRGFDAAHASAGKMASQYSMVNDAVNNQSVAMGGASKEVQRLLDRYDPLGTKLRSLQAEFSNLNRAVMSGQLAGQEGAVDQVYFKLNQEISKTKSLMDVAGGAMESNMGLGISATQRAKQELVILGREAMNGNFSRMPGTLSIIAQGLSPVALGIAGITAAVAAGGYAWYEYSQREKEAAQYADEFTLATRKTSDKLEEEITLLKQRNALLSQGFSGQSDDVTKHLSELQRLIAADVKVLELFKHDAATIEQTMRDLASHVTEFNRLSNDQAEKQVEEKKLKDATHPKKAARGGADPYAALMNQLDERQTLLSAQADPNSKLTETDKYALKVMTELQNGTLKLTEAKKIEMTGKLESALAQDKYNVSLAASTKAEDEAAKVIEKARSSSADYLDQLQFQNSLIGKGTLEVQQLTEARRSDLALEKELKALRDNKTFDARNKGDGKPYNAGVEDVYQAAVEGSKKAAEATKAGALVEINARYEVSRSWDTGTKNAMRNYLDEVTNAAKQSEQLFTHAFKGMEDALVQFVRHGKLDFASLTDNILNDLVRIQIQQSIMAPLTGAMQSGGGLFGMLGGLFGGGGGGGSEAAAWAAGGNATVPMPSFAVGTDYVPRDMIAQIHEGERIVPKAFNPAIGGAGAQGNSAPNVTVQIINQSGQNVTAKQQGGPQPDGRDWILSVVLEAADTNPHFRSAMGIGAH